MISRKTTDEFVSDAIKIHGNKYDYSNVKYINNKTRVIIICRIHGKFKQFPSNHISKHNKNGCPKCAGRDKTNNEFILECQIKHNYTYDYSLTIYKGYYSNISIICKKHGIFNQRAGHHLEGSGCKKCSGFIIDDGMEFIRQASIVHNNKYDYSKVNYINNNTKVNIICKNHGEFLQIPCNHILKKYGCPKCGCRVSKHENDFLNYIKLPTDEYHRQVTILKKQVDGYDPETNTVYEYLGDYWHGNPWKYDLNDYNERAHKKFGYLHKRTFDRLFKLRAAGYKIKYIWETDWNRYVNGIDEEPNIISI